MCVKNWIVVANAARARVLSEADTPRGSRGPSYATVADLVHPESRQKGIDLGDDRAGHAEAEGHGMGTAYPPRTDPREREHDRFARQVARFIEEGIAAGRCAGVVLVASSPFLGRLKGHLGDQAQKLVLRTVVADYTSLDEKALAERLAQHP